MKHTDELIEIPSHISQPCSSVHYFDSSKLTFVKYQQPFLRFLPDFCFVFIVFSLCIEKDAKLRL